MATISIETLSDMIRQGENSAALAVVVALTESAPENSDAWAARAFVEDLLETFEAAKISITRAWTLEQSPDFLFKRASIRLKARHLQAALTDALTTVAKTEPFLINETRLLAAEAQRRLGWWVAALETCAHLPDDTKLWSGGLISVYEIRS
jgi:hypothetical protein